MNWKKLEGTRQLHDHRREDDWTVHLKDEIPPAWVICTSKGTQIGKKLWLDSESIDDVLKWADEAIDGFDLQSLL